jgi:hypothetical protein
MPSSLKPQSSKFQVHVKNKEPSTMVNLDVAMAPINLEDSNNKADSSVDIADDSESNSDDSSIIDSKAKGFKVPSTN